jgi:hypothetical protein
MTSKRICHQKGIFKSIEWTSYKFKYKDQYKHNESVYSDIYRVVFLFIHFGSKGIYLTTYANIIYTWQEKKSILIWHLF